MRHQGPRSAGAVFCLHANHGGLPLRILLRVHQLFAVVFDWNAILCCRVRRQRNRLRRNLARRICIASGTRPRKIVGATSRRYQGCAAAQDLRRNRVGRGLSGVASPTRSPLSPLPMESGSSGPTSGLAPAVPHIGVVSALGSATGTTWLDITRRRSRST